MAVTGDWWLEDWEKAILDFHAEHPLEGYRRLAFMMLDADVVAISFSNVYRLLRDAGLMERHNSKPSLKGQGFQQSRRPHEYWHVDASYLNAAGTYFSLCGLLNGCSRFLVHAEVREPMTEAGVEATPSAGRNGIRTHPRMIADDGPRFIATDFKEFIRISGMTHGRASPSYPQGNGKIKRWHRSLRSECIRPGRPLSLEDARRLVDGHVRHDSKVRLAPRSAP